MSRLRFVGGCGGGGVPTERYGAIRDWRDIHSLDHRTDTSGLHGTGDGSGKYPGNSWHITGTIGTPGLPLCPSESLVPRQVVGARRRPWMVVYLSLRSRSLALGGGPKTRVPIRHAVKPSFGGFDSRWGLRPPSFRATPHTLGGWRHSAVSESGTGLGVTQASRSITRRARKANGLCQGTWRASGRAHASPRGGEGEQRGGGKGFDSPFFVFFSRVGPHHPHRQTLLAKLSLLPGLTSTFRSRCGQHVCSFFTRQRLGEWSPGAPGAV